LISKLLLSVLLIAVITVFINSTPNAFAQPTVSIAVLMDGSGSKVPDDFLLQKNGIASAITNVISPNGSVKMTIIQFASGPGIECGPTVISDVATKNAFIACVNGIGQIGSGTNIDTAINLATATLTPDINAGIITLINSNCIGQSVTCHYWVDIT